MRFGKISARNHARTTQSRQAHRDQSPSKNHQTALQHTPVQTLESRTFLSAVTGASITETPLATLAPDATGTTVTGLTPAEIRTAYGLNLVSFSGGKVAANGSGETIAIVDAYNDPNISSDLKTFDAKFGLANPTLTVVNQTGGSSLPNANASWAQEISLDVEWAHATAPAAKVLLVETNSSSNSDLLAGVSYARKVSGVAAISLSWGGSEFDGETADDSLFTTPSGHTGITFVAASGDDGSSQGVDWPASSPEVVSVGGTTLTTTGTAGTYSGESGWSDSGGGVSRFEGTPEYQTGVQADGARTVPDVSLDANPETGVAVYDSYGFSGWAEVGGTSDAAPQWAGIIAIADQGRAINKLGALDGATNTLPTLYSLYSNATTDAADFHDVTSGVTSRSIAAAKGYDLVTGIGTPKDNGLIPALVSSKISKTLTITPVVGGGGGGRGGHHGPFFQTADTPIPASTVAADAPIGDTVIGASTEVDSTCDLPGFSVQGVVSSGSPSFVSQGGLQFPSTIAPVPNAADGTGMNLALATGSDAYEGAESVWMMPASEQPAVAVDLTPQVAGSDILTSPRLDSSSAVHSFVSTLAHDPATWRSATAAGFVASVLYWFNTNADRARDNEKRRGIFSESPIRP